MNKNELVLLQVNEKQKKEIEALKSENEKLKELISVLQEQAKANGMDVVTYIHQFNELIVEARANLNEVKQLKHELYTQKAKYQNRIEEAIRNIVGDNY